MCTASHSQELKDGKKISTNEYNQQLQVAGFFKKTPVAWEDASVSQWNPNTPLQNYDRDVLSENMFESQHKVLYCYEVDNPDSNYLSPP